MGALSYVFVCGYADTSKQDVMEVASFLFYKGEILEIY